MFYDSGARQDEAAARSLQGDRRAAADRLDSTRALDGRINLAPYSFFNGFSSAPPIVGFSSEGWKDSVIFARESGEFVANLATPTS